MRKAILWLIGLLNSSSNPKTQSPSEFELFDFHSSFPLLISSRFFGQLEHHSRSIATSDVAYFINSSYTLAGISLTTPKLCLFTQKLDGLQLDQALPNMLAIPATSFCTAGLLV